MKSVTPRNCPQCGKPAPAGATAFRPFCSARCRQIDLGEWLFERYRIPDEQDSPPALDDDADPEQEK